MGDWRDGRRSVRRLHGDPSVSECGHSGPAEAPWYEVLGVSPDAPREVIEAAGKAMRRKTHPDVGGNEVDFHEVQEAIREATQGD
jgi:DnaJ-class molecular chaperone